MRARTHLRPAAVIAACLGVAGCSTVTQGVGSPCERPADCGAELQCLEGTCQPRCARAPDCGDGYACTEDGLCEIGAGQPGSRCTSEVECLPGLACVLDVDDGGDGVLDASCAPDHDGSAAGKACAADADCRNGTCALGECVDLCKIDRDCGTGRVCTTIPRVDNDASPAASLGEFHGCLPADATVSWRLPTHGTADELYLPVPGNASAVFLALRVDDPAQYVGASEITEPSGARVYTLVPDAFDPFDPGNLVRHTPTPETSVLMLPSSPDRPLVPGAYHISVGSYHLVAVPTPHLTGGTSVPQVQLGVKLGGGTVLDMHFYFVDLTEHPCAAAMGTINAAAAQLPDSPFQHDFLPALRTIFARAGIALGETTFDDILDHYSLHGLASEHLGDLLALAAHPGGVNVFFVRTIAPVGLSVLSGGDKNPGDPALGSRTGGVAVAVDTLCYRSWPDLARLTAHATAREMGLYRNVEPAPFEGYEDPIADSPGADNPAGMTDNLMYFSEFGGTSLSPGQKDILRRSPSLR